MQLTLFQPETTTKQIALTPQGFTQTPSLSDYSKIIVYFSGGKDSLACVLHLLELGVPRHKIELWHHLVDGKGKRLMDWACTSAYCQAVADALGIPLFFSWKVGGFEGEMLRENALTQPTQFETPEGEIKQVGGTRGKPNIRRKYPMAVADLEKRWCSPYVKIDVAAVALRNQSRFNHAKTLTGSGERAEESPGRAKYKTFEPDRTDNRGKWVSQLKPYEHLPEMVFKASKRARHVDRWRPVHGWAEEGIWAIIERWKINPHPAYHLGWGRVSCLH